MSTIDRPEPRTLPPLVDGQRLDQEAFHERYAAMPPDTRAELVEGVVYMPSPLFYGHGEADEEVGAWLSHYRVATPGVSGAVNATVKLGPKSEVQPDRQLRIPEEKGGQSRIVGGYVAGAPELVVEVAESSRSYDLGAKKRDYEKHGVLEYLFCGVEPAEVRWSSLEDGRFVDLPLGPDGTYRSAVFPGLWLDPQALIARDSRRLIEVLDLGLATAKHAEFVARLAARVP